MQKILDLTEGPVILPAPSCLEDAIAVAKRLYSGSQRLFETRAAADAMFPHLFFTLTSDTETRSWPFVWQDMDEERMAGDAMRAIATKMRDQGLWGVALVTRCDLRLVDWRAVERLGLKPGTFELDERAMSIIAKHSTQHEALAIRLETYMGDWHETTVYDRLADGRVSWHPPKTLAVAESQCLADLLPPPQRHFGSA